MNLVICGQGRIGLPVATKLKQQGLTPVFARLDSSKGLWATTQLPRSIDLLCISISPGRGKYDWHWGNIFQGLVHQVEQGLFAIKNIIFISSTSVYDGICSGMIDAKTKARSGSVRSENLLAAEAAFSQICKRISIVRCCGLIGEGYSTYLPILQQAQDRPRFGIDVAAVISHVEQLASNMLTSELPSQIHLLTNGKVYFQGNVFALNANEDKEKIIQLARKYKILQASCADITSV